MHSCCLRFLELSCNDDRQLGMLQVSRYTNAVSLTTIPVAIGALGMMEKSKKKYTDQIPGSTKICELPKIILMLTTHVLRRFFSI